MIRAIVLSAILASPVVACSSSGYNCTSAAQNCYTTTHHEPTMGSRIKQRLANCLLKRLRNRSYSTTQCCPQQTQMVSCPAPVQQMQAVQCQVPVTTYRTEERTRTVTKLVPQEVEETYSVQVPETTYETRTMQVPVQTSECCQPVQASACKYRP